MRAVGELFQWSGVRSMKIVQNLGGCSKSRYDSSIILDERLKIRRYYRVSLHGLSGFVKERRYN